jgi:hypothetical protein
MIRRPSRLDPDSVCGTIDHLPSALDIFPLTHALVLIPKCPARPSQRVQPPIVGTAWSSAGFALAANGRRQPATFLPRN